MAKKFYVTSNVNHNNTEYQRGDTMSLDAKSPEAQALLNAGAIQTSPLDAEPEEVATETEQEEAPVEPEPEEQAEVQDTEKGPEVGGEAADTGEPSLGDNL